MNKKTLQSLKREEEQKEELKDLWKHIKDLEAELEFLHIREPHEVEYIESVKNVLDNLYIKVNNLKHEIN
jgi:2-polyprenyl-3-methyl-5-hydroxy-6-metoxy-1,4-benzoquinol methylase